MSDVRLSPSRINLFMECERCFWLKMNEGVSRPSGPFPSLPGGMDKVIKQHFDRFRGDGSVPPELKKSDINAVPLDDEEFLSNCRNWRSKPWYENQDLGVVVKGGVDDLLVDPEGNIIVLDYKTRGYPPKGDSAPDYYSRQVNLYNLILRSNGYDTADFGLLLYYYPDKLLDNGDVVFHNEFRKVDTDLDSARRLVESAVETVNGSEPEPGGDCDFCKWEMESHR
ncbi:MAG: PD-(D/E)XK nuclease family protein [Candidatus Nanohaloarchaea archaeon]|nr:PD-(D/E)XK nuclease family protein [Candidatus Nanohaloarchaea archaeon]